MPERPWKISEAHYYDEKTDQHHYGVRVTLPDGSMQQVVVIEGETLEGLGTALKRLAKQLNPGIRG